MTTQDAINTFFQVSKNQSQQQQEYFENLYLKKTQGPKTKVPPSVEESEPFALDKADEVNLKQIT